MRGIAVTLGLGVAGCAQIWGIDETSSGPDAQKPMMSLSFEHLALGATNVRTPYDLTGRRATFLIEDAAAPNGFQRITSTAASNRWEAEIPADTIASIEFSLLDGLRRLYTFQHRDIRGLFAEFRENEPAAAGGMLNATVTLPSPYVSGESFRLYSVGQWAYHQFSAGVPAPDVGAATIGPVNIPFDSNGFISTAGARPLPKLTMADRMVALRYRGAELTGGAEITPFDASGGTDTISAAIATNASAPLDVKIAAQTTATRLDGPAPAGISLSMAWNVSAAPGWEVANNTGITLNGGGIATTTTEVTSPVGNPFEALWKSLFTFSATKSRPITINTLPGSLSSGFIHLAEPTPGVMLDPPAGMPILISINGMQLTADGMNVTLDLQQPVVLDLVTDRTANTFYYYDVYELVPSQAGTQLEYKRIYVAYSPTTKVTIPHDVFEGEHVYTVRAHCISGGYPTFGEGNLQNRNLPHAVGYHDSGWFQVLAP